MIDSGASGLFLHERFIQKHHVRTHQLRNKIPLFNIDGSANQAGTITHFARLTMIFEDQEQEADFLITNIGPEDVILGLPWLREVNPDIDWSEGQLKICKQVPGHYKVTVEEVEDEEAICGSGRHPVGDTLLEEIQGETPEVEAQPSLADETPLAQEALEPELEESPPLYRFKPNRSTRRAWLRAGYLEHAQDELWCAAGYTVSQQIAEQAHLAKKKKTFEEMVPPQYCQYSKVFSEKESECLPEHKPWDHAIEFTPNAPESLRTKVYPMSPVEQEELDRFLEENLRKGYIQPSKSPLASPVFFIKKKDGKLRFIQDYRKINEFTIKNRYPLPLVTDIIGQLHGAKYFTKFDVQWGYNNIRIKAGDEWKAAFTTNQGLFEPTVMFFGLTNSPATVTTIASRYFARF